MRQFFLTLIKQAHGTSVGPYGIPMITMQNVKRKSFKLALVKFLIEQNLNFITKLINEPFLFYKLAHNLLVKNLLRTYLGRPFTPCADSKGTGLNSHLLSERENALKVTLMKIKLQINTNI